MKTLFYSLILVVSSSFANVVTDTSMQASKITGTYEQPMGFGPFVEFSHLDASTLTEVMKVEGRRYNVDAEISNLYGVLGFLPLNNWISLFAVAGFQQLKIEYSDLNTKEAYKQLAKEEDSGFSVIDSSDIEGKLNSYNFIVEIGTEAGIPIIESYQYQFMFKLVGFIGGLGGRAFFDETKFLNPMIWGYVYGIGARIAWEKISIFGGLRSTHFYWHTYFEKNTGTVKDDDSFMMDFTTMSMPFISLCVDF